MTLDKVPLGQVAVIIGISGERLFRRRLMEMGLVPGVTVEPVNVAPLGDPIEIAVLDGRMSIRRHEAATVMVTV